METSEFHVKQDGIWVLDGDERPWAEDLGLADEEGWCMCKGGEEPMGPLCCQRPIRERPEKGRVW